MEIELSRTSDTQEKILHFAALHTWSLRYLLLEAITTPKMILINKTMTLCYWFFWSKLNTRIEVVIVSSKQNGHTQRNVRALIYCVKNMLNTSWNSRLNLCHWQRGFPYHGNKMNPFRCLASDPLSANLPYSDHSQKLLLIKLFLFTETTSAERKVDIRIFDRSYTVSKEDLERKLTKAALTERGYKKTTTFSQSDEEESEAQLRKIVRYQKRVPCQKMAMVEDELRRSIPGAWGYEVSSQVQKEAAKKREKKQRCTAGIEIHFPSKRCQLKKNIKRAVPVCTTSACFMCFFATVQWTFKWLLLFSVTN